MATSVITAASSADHQQAASPSPHEYGRREPAGSQPARRGPGRRKARGSDGGQRKNKQPQRGMGVEKLEKLRMQDRWKKISEIGAVSDPAVQFSEPIHKLGGYGAPGMVGLSPGFQYGLVEPFGSGARCYSELYNACHKKKKSSVGDCGFLGLNNVGENQNHHQRLNVGTKMAPETGFGNSGKQGHVEIVAIHRKGSSISSAVMMEYEFFPGSKTDHSQINDELPIMNPFGSSSPQTPSNYVDLSLKLSY